ncbi:MAG TPA: SLC13 family permease, partial [Candidatus Aminicenantes bacterium]|nr:SLC13 family permease [Candidatus Aminicenantes bacterium]
LLSLAGAGLLLMLLFRAEFARAPARPPARPPTALPPYDRHQARKGMAVTAVLLVLLFTPLPRELSALVLAGILLCSRRMTTRKLLGGVDWHLITLFCALFVLIAGIATTGLPGHLLTVFQSGGEGKGLGQLILLTTGLSNLVSNVPAVMLLTRLLPAGDFTAWVATALASTFAGNLITIGSIANLIVIEGAREHGVKISFRDHARVGVPVTALSLLITYFWLH